MRFLFHFKTLVIAACLILSVPAYAQSLDVRSGSHDGYSRLVFDWAEAPVYKVTKSGGQLTIGFDKSAPADVSAVNAEQLKNIGTVNILSGAGAPLKLSVQINEDSDFRHFKIGKKVIVDVYDAAGEPSRVAATTSRTTGTQAQAPSSAPSPATPAPSRESLAAAQLADVPEILEEPLEELNYTPVEGTEPHVITLTATQNVSAAVFERAGFIWMVFSRADLKTDPVLAGPKANSFPKIEKIELPNAVAYRMAKPEGFFFYGEGGGLLWRLVLTPNPRQTKPLKPKADNGQLVWPMTQATKTVTLTDPLIGDEIQAVTVKSSGEYSGARRQYVDLEVLPSYIGLAFVPKADDVVATRDERGVSISKPQGLAISPERDVASAELKDDIQKENEFFDLAANPSTLSRLYDFNSWEMGGQNALERNRRILMRDVGTKVGADKVEDLLTLAKLNIANDRGQEALGIMRVAAQELPGIDEDGEFIALQGAAATLAQQYDEAIEFLVNPKLNSYGEMGYWRAAALAGLEDWRQAANVMPEDMRLLESYPKQIQVPIGLKLAEVSLRAGNPQKAEEILTMMQPEFSQMSLANQSAWKYLNGELENQKGNDETALENWQPLLTGKDDYYRAKAALSVTKMQLERQKITNDKAIDRLEGLRYAWRGDELESLINLRLGEVYIQNGDYLKGLSTLRSAVSLSPNSKISEQITTYMTDTFTSLFTEGKLSEVSALDAVSIYDEFKELTPAGEEGDIFVQELAERLVDVDLLGRAANLLDHQLTHRLQGEAAANVGIRLAAIRLLDNKPDGALRALDVAAQQLGRDGNAEKRHQIRLLRARALSKSGQSNEALSLLSNAGNEPEVLRLRADIAWNGSVWDEAAKAFGQLIDNESISKTRPPNDYQTTLILNRAIALNLSGNRTALDRLRNEYNDLMAQSEKARLFDLISRPRQLGMLADRESVSSLISEVDLFGEFLESYKDIN